MKDKTIEPTYAELRARLPESDRAKFDEMVEGGCPIELLAEEVDRYLSMRRFWVEVPQEAKDGLDRMLEAGEALEGLPDDEVVRVYREHLMVKRAGDFTEARRRRFMRQVHLVRVRATSSRQPTSTERPRARSRRTAARRAAGPRSGTDPGDEEGEPEPPPRPCQNPRCEADLSHRPKADYCDSACKQAAYRHRRTIEHLDELVGTSAADLSCGCNPRGHFVIGGVCFHCGRPRGEVTRAWLDDDLRARSFVSSRAPARRNPRLGDRKRKPIREFVDKSITEAVAA